MAAEARSDLGSLEKIGHGFSGHTINPLRSAFQFGRVGLKLPHRGMVELSCCRIVRIGKPEYSAIAQLW
jgi:hypothetical protein